MTATSATLSAAFATAVAGYALPEPAPASLIGLEHEYGLWRGASPVDFRDLVHRLPVPGRRLDPGDSNAYRLDSGLVMTADDAEAEVATPPLDVGPGFARRVAGWAAHGLGQLQNVLPPDVDAFGYSTHLSASLPLRQQAEVLDLFAHTFAPSLMLLMEKRESFGVYLRPRPGRLEFCAEYVAGDYLSASAAVFAGGVRACSDAAATNEQASVFLPPVLDARLRPATGRYGSFVSARQAFGVDLYAAGRLALLPLQDGGSITAQRHFELTVEAARCALPEALTADLALAGRIVTRDLPLRVEADDNSAALHHAPPPEHPQGSVLRRWTRPSYTVDAVVATWDFTVFRLQGPRQAYACIPRDSLPPFLTSLSKGSLDSILDQFMATPSNGEILSSNAQTQRPGLWDSLAAGPDLLAAEPHPETGRYGPAQRKPIARLGLPSAGEGAQDTSQSTAPARASKPEPRPAKAFLPVPSMTSRPPGLPLPKPNLAGPNQQPSPDSSGVPTGQGPPVLERVTSPPPLVDPTPHANLLPTWWPVVAGVVAVLVLIAGIVFAGAGDNASGPPLTPTPTLPAAVADISTSPTPVRDVVLVVPTSTPATEPAATATPIATASAPVVATPVPPRPSTPVPPLNTPVVIEPPVPVATVAPVPTATVAPAVIGVTIQKILTGFSGSQASFQISVTNPGSVAVNASVRDTLPPGVSIVSVGSAGWVCSTTPGAQGGATCTSAVPLGATLAFNVTVSVPVPFAAWQNCATLTASLPGSTSVATAQACANVPASAAAPTPTPRPALVATPTPRPCTPSPGTICG